MELSKNFRKDGIVRSKQRYYCKDCALHFTVEQTGKPVRMKKEALILYPEGIGFRSTGRISNVSHVAVYNRIKSFGEKPDEMHTYIVKKNFCRIRIAVDRNGHRFISFEAGTRYTETGKKLRAKIMKYSKGIVCPDYRKAYEKFVPR